MKAQNYKPFNNLFYKSYLPSIVNQAIEVGLFQQLQNNIFSVSELAKKMQLHEGLLGTLLKVLLYADFLEIKNNIYYLKEATSLYFLKASLSNQIHGLQRFIFDSPFKNLKEILKNGPPEYIPNRWSTKESMQAIEQDAKAGSIDAIKDFVISHSTFYDYESMCDYGGNTGYYSKKIIEYNSQLSVDIYDRKEVCEIAETIILNTKNEKRINFIPYDINIVNDFNKTYDIFLASHILYHYMGLKGVKDSLDSFLQKVYSFINPGGLFISNHCGIILSKEDTLTNEIMELNVKISGFPTHIIPEELLETLLIKNGFKIINKIPANEGVHYGTSLISAMKI